LWLHAVEPLTKVELRKIISGHEQVLHLHARDGHHLQLP
jgi:hypothetical protein